MWGIPYDDYMLLNEMSTMSAGSRDLHAFGNDGLVYVGSFLFSTGEAFYVAAEGRVRMLPKALLQGFMASEQVADQVEFELAVNDTRN